MARTILTIIIVPAFLWVSNASASVIYDLDCIGPRVSDCIGRSGYFEFSDSAVAAGSFNGTADNWLAFSFFDGVNNIILSLANIVANDPGDIEFVLTGDQSKIMSITDSVG